MNTKKMLKSALIVVVAGLTVTGFADRVSGDLAEGALTRALTTYAIARTLNGVISVAQGTEIAVEPAGVGVTMTPGQILDPVNDLIERFSSVMLVAASSIGLQLLLLEILSSIAVSLAVLAGLALWLAALWSDKLRNHEYAPLALRVATIVILVRFALPVVIIGSNLIFDAFLQETHDAATSELQGTTREVQGLAADYTEVPDAQGAGADQPDGPPPGSSAAADAEGIATRMSNAIREWYEDVADSLENSTVSSRINSLKTSAANVTNHIVDLIVVFMLQTVIVPLVFLWLFVEAMKAIVLRSLPGGGGST